MILDWIQLVASLVVCVAMFFFGRHLRRKAPIEPVRSAHTARLISAMHNPVTAQQPPDEVYQAIDKAARSGEFHAFINPLVPSHRTQGVIAWLRKEGYSVSLFTPGLIHEKLDERTCFSVTQKGVDHAGMADAGGSDFMEMALLREYAKIAIGAPAFADKLIPAIPAMEAIRIAHVLEADGYLQWRQLTRSREGVQVLRISWA